MATIRLAVLAEGSVAGWTVLPLDRLGAYHGAGEHTYLCGRCDAVLALGSLARGLIRTAIQCPHCGAFNAL
jgi:DNA-directed RNA polymerase subunit RPC12/RpoP